MGMIFLKAPDREESVVLAMALGSQPIFSCIFSCNSGFKSIGLQQQQTWSLDLVVSVKLIEFVASMKDLGFVTMRQFRINHCSLFLIHACSLLLCCPGDSSWALLWPLTGRATWPLFEMLQWSIILCDAIVKGSMAGLQYIKYSM